MKRYVPPFSLLAAIGIAAACAHEHPASAEAAHDGVHAEAHWSYEGPTGPEHWGSLSPAFALCATGKSQSPIDIRDATSVDLPNLVFHYAPTPVEIVNNGHTVQVNYAAGSYVEVDGVRYDLVQFHFHAPSEHTIAGRFAAAEMHLVHKSATGALAVVGVLLEEGEHNARFDPVWNNLPGKPGAAQRFAAEIDADDLLPADPRTYRYMGSLTTPPGTEDVHWNLMVEPVRLSKAQIAAFTKVYRGNNRPIQALNGRKVLQDSSR
jgi:carbonic anhydrase